MTRTAAVHGGMDKDYAPSVSAPLLRVSRPVSACSRCRSAKVKCDGKLPACSACERSGKAHECTGGQDQFARGKERSYVSSLESRIERLEKKLAMVSQRRGSVGMVDVGTPAPVEQELQIEPSSPASAKKKKDESGDIEDIVSDFGYMTINATSRDFHKSVTCMSFSKIVLKASSVSKSLDNITPNGLPARNIATQFIQHYFDKIFPLTPCLSETSFFVSLDLVYKNESQATNFDRFIVYMVLAIGTMSLSRFRDSPAAQNAASWVKKALEFAEGVISTVGIVGVQATLLLLQYSMLEPSHFNSWYLIGVASRIAIDIGLHQETAGVRGWKAAELDLRRRIFYCVYAHDRAISMVLQRPFSFSDDSISVLLPRSIAQSAPDNDSWHGTLVNKASARHLFKLRQLQSSWYQLFYHTGDALLPSGAAYTASRRAELAAWYASMPDSISPVVKDWLTLEYHYISVYVSAPCPKIPHPSDDAWKAIFSHAVSYAMRFADILGDVNHRIVYTYHDGLRTYYVGSNLLHAIWGKEDVVLGEESLQTAMDAIKATISILSHMVTRWDNAASLVEKFTRESNFMLSRLERTARAVEAARAEQARARRQHELDRRALEQARHPPAPVSTAPFSPSHPTPDFFLPPHSHSLPLQPNTPTTQPPPPQPQAQQVQQVQQVQFPTWGGPGDVTPTTSGMAEEMDSVLFSHLTTAEFGNVAFYHSLQGQVSGMGGTGGGGYM